MMISPLQVQLLGAEDFGVTPGFRLHRLEVYNWGTFDGRVWTVRPNGNTSLLTGDIGSGKSTLVDAVSTLLVPAQRITYNKAAGADARERSLRSYVLGYYKAERGDGTWGSKPVTLRDHNSYSVVLGHFRNVEYDLDVTLAQVFWIQDGQGQPNRFYVVADRALEIAADFSGFGSDLAALRKRLREQADVRIHDNFPPYGADFRRRFGIDNDQALELFNQTVSMKSVGNLTSFVREHMLEAFPVESRIEALIKHFADLDHAYQAVVRARQQIEALEPLVADVDRFAEETQSAVTLRACRDALRPWFAQIKAGLLEKRIERHDRDLERLSARIRAAEERRREKLGQRDELRTAVAASGGDRIERLKSEIKSLTEEQGRRREKADEYQRHVEALGLDRVSDEDGFLANRRAADKVRLTLDARYAEVQNASVEASVQLRDAREQRDEVQKEITSLRGRRSNIPGNMLDLRDRLAAGIGVDPEEIPFAGELIEVRENEKAWEGAIERLLHNFGLSLLVPDRHYPSVSEWVDRTHLRGRLVYYRVRDWLERTTPELHAQSLVHKLAIRPESGFYNWLEFELSRRFDYACCADLTQFRKEQRAITRAGQIKGGDGRHEKDDRFNISDRSRYVLGWSNEAKIAALEKHVRDLEQVAQAAAAKVAELDKELTRLRERSTRVAVLLAIADFRELDWQTPTLAIEARAEELRRLTEASDRLRELQKQLEAVEAEVTATEDALKEDRDKESQVKLLHKQAWNAYEEAVALLDQTPAGVKEHDFPRLEALRAEALGDRQVTVESCDNREGEMRAWLQRQIDAKDKVLDRLKERIVGAMTRYNHAWPAETREVDPSVASGGAYKAMLEQLQSDALPRFEERFRQLLRENTIREVANFQAHLNKERATIVERIAVINESLKAIDYNPGRYIALLAEQAHDPEVREFREALRRCTEGALTGSDDEYSEQKFVQVKEIIERFKGREGTADLDRRWTRKVTDVRNWFVFSASERLREDETEYEHYTDSGGKSGGQKEKLAYTVLAASLAYQFGLGISGRRRTFRFVVIDEAFGRGSDESARYGLELFRRLGLQLLVVTPLQKIHVIEPYVSSVAFVHNEDDRQSMVRNLTIEEYRAERSQRANGSGENQPAEPRARAAGEL